MKNDEQALFLFGISLSTRPRWQQFLLCSSGFFFGYLVNGVCEASFMNLYFFSALFLSGVWSPRIAIKELNWIAHFLLVFGHWEIVIKGRVLIFLGQQEFSQREVVGSCCFWFLFLFACLVLCLGLNFFLAENGFDFMLIMLRGNFWILLVLYFWWGICLWQCSFECTKFVT